MSEAEQRLLQLIKSRAFKRGDFRLASGAHSDYYVDGKMVEVFSESAHLIGEVVYKHTRDLDFEAIGGLEVGAVPLTTAAVISYHLHGRVMEGFWVRDRVKDHGTRRAVEGNLVPKSRVVVLEDVATSGGSAMRAVEAVREAGCEVVMVLALLDRLQGARELFGGVGYRAVFTVRDLGID